MPQGIFGIPNRPGRTPEEQARFAARAGQGNTLGGLLGRIPGLSALDFSPRSKDALSQATSGERAGLFGVPDEAERRRRLLGLATQLGGQGAPISPFDAQQQGFVNQLAAQARGEGPSLAALMAQEAGQRAISGQQALAAGAAPGQAAQASRLASQQASALGGSIAGQAAQARVQEQLGALQQLGVALQAARGLDIESQLQARQLAQQAQMELLRQELQQAELSQRGGLTREQLRVQQLAALLGVPTAGEQARGLLTGILGANQ